MKAATPMTGTATVLARFVHEVLVDVDGRNRLVANTVLRDIRVGDRVMIRGGTVTGRVDVREGSSTGARPARAEPGPDPR